MSVKFPINKFITLSLISSIFFPILVNQEINFAKENNLIPNYKYLELREPIDYILDSGDLIRINLNPKRKTAEQEIHQIDIDGTIYLEEIGKIYVSGLTINELKKILNESFSNILKLPEINIEVVRNRPLKIYIKGEVTKPGLYSFTAPKNSVDNKLTQLPTIFDAIKNIGGFTLYSDLKNISIIRKDSLSNGGGFKKASINLLNFFENGNQSEIITLRDGDTIVVEKSDSPVSKQLRQAMQSNINPSTVAIFIGGQVINPGMTSVNKRSTLNEAIFVAGGPKVARGPITFFRYLNDGSIETKKFRIDLKAQRGTYKNPFIRDGDIIYVGKTKFSIISDIITDITSPFVGIGTTIGTYKLIQE